MLGHLRLARALASCKNLQLRSELVDRIRATYPTACVHGSSAHGFDSREAVRPGDTVQLLFASKAGVSVTVGDHESFDMKVAVPTSAAVAPLEVTRSSSEGGYSRLTFVELPSSGHTDCDVQAKAPARFVSLEIRSAGGDVYVESMKEASLSVESHGGSIRVPSLKGDQAVLHSGGGAIGGSVTAAWADIRSAGGAVKLKSLVGKAVAVDSQGGPVTVGACYADQAAITSGGAPLTIGTLQCQTCLVDSQGGAISVDSVQGSAQVLSGGGDIQVHVQPATQQLLLSTSGGRITLFLSPGMPGSLRFPAGARISVPDGLQRAEPLDDGVDARTTTGSAGMVTLQLQPSSDSAGGSSDVPFSRLQASREGEPGLSHPIIQLQPGSGDVLLRQRSWMEAMQHKIRGA